jgi:hypothetical protein
MRSKIILRLTPLLLGGLLFCGCTHKRPTPSPTPRVPSPAPGAPSLKLSIPSAARGEISSPKLMLASCYEPQEFSVALTPSGYSLPLALEEITNLQDVESRIRLGGNQKQLLQSNGFVVIPWHGDDMVEPYESMKEQGVPIFVSSDTLLHLYHIQFNEILRRIEEIEFFDQLIDMSKAMLEESIENYRSFADPDLREAARRDVAYFAVALNLLQTPTEGYDEEQLQKETEEWNRENPQATREFKPIRKVGLVIPDYVKEEVEEEIRNIEEHRGFGPSAIFNSDAGCACDRPGCYCEDYSQYVPRGHYTTSERLKRFFGTMMWYGRMAFLLKGGEEALVSEEDARIATIQAALISSQLSSVRAGESTAQEVWDRIYSVTSFFVGIADDLTPYEYLDAMEGVFGTQFQASELADEQKLLDLKVELAKLRNPEIYGGSGICIVATKEELYECLARTKGMRFMGQRFVPDSYIFQNLVSPAVGTYVGERKPFTLKSTMAGPVRSFPRGLDVMAVLGSKRAYEILKEEGDTEYEGRDTSYDKQLSELREEFDAFDVADWNRNLYWAWLYALEPLVGDFGEGYPTFMQTQAWQDKELSTALASWAELRHDTILYAKPSYTPGIVMAPAVKPVVGYVEPIPEFYARMFALTRMTKDGLAQLNALGEEERSRLESLERILERLLSISRDELENIELEESDYEFIRSFGGQLDSIVAGVETEGKQTTIVADVHTDTNPPQEVLEEGIGYVDLILAAYKVPDGRIILGAGPVFSYYEFKQPIGERLTDEKWKKTLEQEEEPGRPDWIETFYAAS